MTEIVLSRKNFKDGAPLNIHERKVRTMAKNIEASKLIVAAKALRKTEESKFIDKKMLSDIASIKENKTNNSDMVKVLDKQIKEMDRRIDIYQTKMEEGTLRKGERAKMQMYEEHRTALILEKKKYQKSSNTLTDMAEKLDGGEKNEKVVS